MDVSAKPEPLSMGVRAATPGYQQVRARFRGNCGNGFGRAAHDRAPFDPRAGIAGDIDCVRDGSSGAALWRCRLGARHRE